MQGMLFGKKQFFLSITFFVSCKIIFVHIIFFALTVCLKINPIHLDENGYFFLYSMLFCQGKLLCWNSLSEKYFPKNSYLLFSNSLLWSKNNLIYFLQQVGMRRKRLLLFSAREAVVSCKVLRTYKVTSFVRKNISLCTSILMKIELVISLILALTLRDEIEGKT